ncbi:MAG: sodium:solute symporter family protein [Schleiferiaceae bacterium]|nr:sodium:solute symporter family protein [Schleiferiaceae bacterium]
MALLDVIVFVIYFVGMLSMGIYFFQQNKSIDDYYVGSKEIKSFHIGLSVVATDVGGGFSIGLGGLGFAIGLSGSWMLFTGLLGAWLTAVVLIPKVFQFSKGQNFHTLPQLFGYLFNARVAWLAGLISAIGYLGFTSSQLLAGAKMAAATFPTLDKELTLLIMGLVAVIYTSIGGLKAVIYTDTVQWIILMGGLLFIGIPVSYFHIGGWEAIQQTLAPEFLQLNQISWITIFNWGITIIPIWFVGMTLYQRMFASRSKKDAQKAWFLAGLLEWPIMAFMGVTLGLFARVAFEQGLFNEFNLGQSETLDPEMGLPILLNTVLPAGIMGILLAAYFSAILSTADSCLMAASGNVQTDLLKKWLPKSLSIKKELRISQIITLSIGAIALLIALNLNQVLDAMLYSYAFMVSGLFVPLVFGMFTKYRSPQAAFGAMLIGGITNVVLTSRVGSLPYGIDANFFGILAALCSYLAISAFTCKHHLSQTN